MKYDKYNMIIVSALCLFLHCCAQAGIKGGTLFIKNVIPAVYEQMNRQDGYVRSTIETLTLTVTKKVYFCVPADLKDFRVTYNKRPVAEGQVDGG